MNPQGFFTGTDLPWSCMNFFPFETSFLWFSKIVSFEGKIFWVVPLNDQGLYQGVCRIEHILGVKHLSFHWRHILSSINGKLFSISPGFGHCLLPSIQVAPSVVLSQKRLGLANFTGAVDSTQISAKLFTSLKKWWPWRGVLVRGMSPHFFSGNAPQQHWTNLHFTLLSLQVTGVQDKHNDVSKTSGFWWKKEGNVCFGLKKL